jgi:hypothetical protein
VTAGASRTPPSPGIADEGVGESGGRVHDARARVERDLDLHFLADLDAEFGAELLAEPEQVLATHSRHPGGHGHIVDRHLHRR